MPHPLINKLVLALSASAAMNQDAGQPAVVPPASGMKEVVTGCGVTASGTPLPIHDQRNVEASMDPTCPVVNHFTAEFHMPNACNLEHQNLYRNRLNRFATHQRLNAGAIQYVPNEHTGFCPQTLENLHAPNAAYGFDTTWVVENAATTPVAVAFLQETPPGSGNFIEVSAVNSHISPPHHDPEAIMAPGQWKAIQTHEGHVFHVRQIMKDGGLGPVLMQHRAGLIPIKNKYGHELTCDPNDPDLEPIKEVNSQVVRDEDFARTPPREIKPCNALEVGFRNMVGCPLNAYYTGQHLLKGNVKPRGNVTKLKETLAATGAAGVHSEGHTAKSCHEVFKFHLGLQDQTPDFMWDWNSKTKFETTFMSHNYVFRYAKDERIVVDSVALQPSRVIDCPGLKKQVAVVSHSEAEAVVTDVGATIPQLNNQWNNNTTIGRNLEALDLAAPVLERRARRRTAAAAIGSL